MPIKKRSLKKSALKKHILLRAVSGNNAAKEIVKREGWVNEFSELKNRFDSMREAEEKFGTGINELLNDIKKDPRKFALLRTAMEMGKINILKSKRKIGPGGSEEALSYKGRDGSNWHIGKEKLEKMRKDGLVIVRNIGPGEKRITLTKKGKALSKALGFGGYWI